MTSLPPFHNRKRPPFIKICGQTHASIADCAVSFGARYIGFVFHHGSPRSISPERAASINSANVGRVGVFVRQRAPEILDIMRQARLDYAQLHGAQSVQDALEIGSQRVIRVLWPERCACHDELQRQIDEWEPYCACYLLDAGDACGSGGLGRRLDVRGFDLLHFPHPWILAGGLNENNIPEVLQRCSPDGLDLNSGIESAPGMKVPVRMLRAITAALRWQGDYAFRASGSSISPDFSR